MRGVAAPDRFAIKPGAGESIIAALRSSLEQDGCQTVMNSAAVCAISPGGRQNVVEATAFRKLPRPFAGGAEHE
jgi:hypothetical protein